MRERAPAFDWRTLVAQSQPGDATASQRAQADRLRRVTADLSAWADQFALLTAFTQPSAMFAVVCTQPNAPDELTRSLSRLILWIYSLDTTLDSQPLERIGDPAWVEATTRASVAPLLTDLRPSMARRLGWDAPALTSETPTLPIIGRLSAALADWRETTLRSWERLVPVARERRFWRETLAEQLARNVAVMRQELAWTSAWRANRLAAQPSSIPTPVPAPDKSQLAPTVGAYLAVAIRSVGVYPTFALVCPALGATPADWARRRSLLNAAARTVRLANDAHTAEADLAERNITAVTSALLRQRAANRRPAGAPESPKLALNRAKAQVAQRLDAAIGVFARRLAEQPNGPDAGYLRYTVAWALAHYSQT